mmetsp:Transcript_795/g.3290  ORF Transcript_795/g.3290 Transcript_795/m.3290 type:complete len:140 (-) Transcript_795:1521-1940(-)
MPFLCRSFVLSAALLLSCCSDALARDTGSKVLGTVALQSEVCAYSAVESRVRGGFNPFAGYHPFGYKITPLGEQFLAFNGIRDSDLGRLLSSLKSRKTYSTIKREWIELTRFSKTAQAAHIMKSLREMLDFLLAARLID